MFLDKGFVIRVIKEFKKTTTATAAGTSLNKRFNEQNNGCARALYNSWYSSNFLHFYFKFIAVSQIQFRVSFDSDRQSKWLKGIARFVGKI